MKAKVLGALLAVLVTLLSVTPLEPASARRIDDPNHGALLSSEPLALQMPWWLRYTAARMTYRSTDARGASTEVTGVVIRPDRPAPEGGWPVMAIAHSTTGILRPCAPSLSPTLVGQIDLVSVFVNLGYAVALTDYQGLGGPGGHPYLDNQTAARNVIDSVLAMRQVWPDTSTRWATLGLSQGGGPAWSADELASSYGQGLRLTGAVAVSPPADMSGLVAKSSAGTMDIEQRPAMQWILAGLAQSDPTFPLDRFRSPDTVASWDTMTGCEWWQIPARNAAVAELGPFSLAPHDKAAARLLTKRLKAMAVAQRPITAPLLVIYGTEDVLADPPWTTAAVDRQRALGGDVRADLQQGRTHDSVDLSAVVPFLTGVLPPASASAQTSARSTSLARVQVPHGM